MDATSREEEISSLDLDISSLVQRVKNLRARRNSLTQLCRIPDEVIARIIWHSQVSSTGHNDDQRRRFLRTAFGDFDHTWANVTLVCQHIRRVALDTAYLWSVLECRQDTTRLQWSQLNLERAKDAALTVHVTLNTLVHKQSTSPSDLLESAAASTRHLHVDVQPGILEKDNTDVFITRLIEMRLPRLEWLKISVPKTYMLTRQFLDGACDRLARASITNLNLSRAQPPAMPVLVWLHLAVRDIGRHGTGLHALLQQLPCLECLDVQADGRTLPDKEFHFNEEVSSETGKPLLPRLSLPRLRILHLTAKITWIASILAMVPIPTEALYIENTSGRHLRRDVEVEEIVPWDFSSKSAVKAYSVVHQGLLAFWHQKPENKDVMLPDGRIVTAIVDSTIYIGHPFLPKHVIPNSPTPFIHFHSRTSLEQYIPLFENIATLYFHDSVAIPNTTARAMAHVKQIVVEKAMNMESLGVLPMWVDIRSLQGRPFQRIDFATCSEKLVREFADTLAQKNLVEQVTWEGEFL